MFPTDDPRFQELCQTMSHYDAYVVWLSERGK